MDDEQTDLRAVPHRRVQVAQVDNAPELHSHPQPRGDRRLVPVDEGGLRIKARAWVNRRSAPAGACHGQARAGGTGVIRRAARAACLIPISRNSPPLLPPTPPESPFPTFFVRTHLRTMIGDGSGRRPTSVPLARYLTTASSLLYGLSSTRAKRSRTRHHRVRPRRATSAGRSSSGRDVLFSANLFHRARQHLQQPHDRLQRQASPVRSDLNEVTTRAPSRSAPAWNGGGWVY